MLQSVRLVGSRGRPRGLPLGPCRLEACRDPHEVKMHPVLLSVSKGARCALRLRGRRERSRRSAAASRLEADDVEHPLGRAGPAIENPSETVPATTSHASMPEVRR